jgi:hypothetical protein
MLHEGGGGGELGGRELRPVRQGRADVGRQCAEENSIKKDITIGGDEGAQLGIVGGDVLVAERRLV